MKVFCFVLSSCRRRTRRHTTACAVTVCGPQFEPETLCRPRPVLQQSSRTRMAPPVRPGEASLQVLSPSSPATPALRPCGPICTEPLYEVKTPTKLKTCDDRHCKAKNNIYFFSLIFSFKNKKKTLSPLCVGSPE